MGGNLPASSSNNGGGLLLPDDFNAIQTASRIASWTSAIRFFACDFLNGDDGNRGYSDVSQQDSRNYAVKTLSRLMQIVPRFGAGRSARIAVLAGNYASDTVLDLSGFVGYQYFCITGTGDCTSANSTAFSGDSNDAVSAGMQIASGTSPNGYEVVSYTVDSSGTTTMQLQMRGGGSPGFGAMPANPYGCRVRFDSLTPTIAARNTTSGVILTVAADTVMLSLAFPAPPAVGDVCYFESPGVTGPATTIMDHSGGSAFGPPQIIGLSLGGLVATDSHATFCGCQTTAFNSTDSSMVLTDMTLDSNGNVLRIGSGVRAKFIVGHGGSWNILGTTCSNTTASAFFQPGAFVWERSAMGAQLQMFGGAHATGTSQIETVGTHSSTVHGATCQIWGTVAPGQGTLRCGLWLTGGYRLGRIKFSNMGANPCIRQTGVNFGTALTSGLSGGVSDGNLDVGLDLGPNGRSGDTAGAVRCAISLETQPTATGSTGDVRLPDGTIKSWAQVMAGLTDTKGNQFIS